MAKLIGTHNGQFHCDESLAVFMLRQTEAFRGSQLIRTRDPEKLKGCDVVVDVGGVYDPAENRFDHHQRGFFETFTPDYQTKLSSAGLVYKHFGKEIISSRLGIIQTDPKLETLFKKIYEDFIEALDAIDNGISQYPPEISRKYNDTTNLSHRVRGLNSWWNQKDVDEDAQFSKAVELTGGELLDKIDYLGHAWLPARDLVVKAFQERYDVDKSGRIILLDQACPWKEHLFNREEELKINPEANILYTVYPDRNEWRVQCVPITLNSFDARKLLPEAWKGFRDAELSERTGIEQCVFVHIGRFIGGNSTREGALEMARKALEIQV
ncbi:hypothetical protein G9A89_013296 [Geosiphon pyriformis]|nr:hypothetical protein G9A89_013296 [Geosiphon pyriformis]